MYYQEYGIDNKETIMMLHGGGLSWWNYKEEAKLLCLKYHVLLVIIDGHGEDNDPFVSIEECADKLIAYINKYYNGKIKALCGLSLGAQIVTEMLIKDQNICDYALIESVSLIPSKITSLLIGPSFSMSYGLIKKKWFSRLQFKYLHINDSLYEDYYRDSCLIKKEDLIAFMKANTSYCLKDKTINTKTRIKIVYGSKELLKIKRSSKLLHSKLSNSEIVVKNLAHGEFSLNKPDEYVEELLKMFNV